MLSLSEHRKQGTFWLEKYLYVPKKIKNNELNQYFFVLLTTTVIYHDSIGSHFFGSHLFFRWEKGSHEKKQRFVVLP
jgi:hypothetical protein